MHQRIAVLIDQGDREGCVNASLGWLTSGAGDIVSLYEEILAPYLNSMGSEAVTPESIWREHLRSSIVRTVVESCYPMVIKEKELRKPSPKGKALVLCPDDELHELGARMVSDLLVLCGFDSVYIGANTPKAVVISAVRDIKPTMVAVSVTNFYNLSVAAETIRLIKEAADGAIKVIVGGRAFKRNPAASKFVGADAQLDTYEDMVQMFGGG